MAVVDSDDSEGIQMISRLETELDDMVARFPDHVQEITTRDEVVSLLAAGRVIDESMKPASTPVGSSGDRELDGIPFMPLHRHELKLGRVAAVELDEDSVEAKTKGKGAVASRFSSIYVQGTPLWESGPLDRRDLDIPAGSNTNPTGSMLFTKGRTPDIDQRHYFREVVFGSLDWARDDRKEHLERAKANFRIVIKAVDYGVFQMRLTHDSRTDSATYQQNNAVTQIHWGEVKELIAKEDLLGRTAFLYGLDETNDLFVLEID